MPTSMSHSNQASAPSTRHVGKTQIMPNYLKLDGTARQVLPRPHLMATAEKARSLENKDLVPWPLTITNILKTRKRKAEQDLVTPTCMQKKKPRIILHTRKGETALTMTTKAMESLALSSAIPHPDCALPSIESDDFCSLPSAISLEDKRFNYDNFASKQASGQPAELSGLASSIIAFCSSAQRSYPFRLGWNRAMYPAKANAIKRFPDFWAFDETEAREEMRATWERQAHALYEGEWVDGPFARWFVLDWFAPELEKEGVLLWLLQEVCDWDAQVQWYYARRESAPILRAKARHAGEGWEGSPGYVAYGDYFYIETRESRNISADDRLKVLLVGDEAA